MISGILLDLDGTLINSNDLHARAWEEALLSHGHTTIFADIRQKIGMGADQFLPLLIPGVTPPEQKILSQTWRHIFMEKYLDDIIPTPGSRQLIQSLQERDIMLIVATSSEEVLVKALLKQARLDDLLTLYTTASHVETSKPAPDIIQAALAEIELPAQEVILIGDTPYDIQSAQKSQVATIAVLCGGFNSEELSGAVALYKDPADIYAHLEESPIFSQSYLSRNSIF